LFLGCSRFEDKTAFQLLTRGFGANIVTILNFMRDQDANGLVLLDETKKGAVIQIFGVEQTTLLVRFSDEHSLSLKKETGFFPQKGNDHVGRKGYHLLSCALSARLVGTDSPRAARCSRQVAPSALSKT